jgi:hypothetical protein
MEENNKEKKNENEEHPIKPLLKHKKDRTKSKTEHKGIVWDNKTIEEQYEERRLHPRQKIDEPKTPYIPYEKGDDEYLKKVTEVNKIEGTEDVLNDVINQLKNVKNETQKEEEFLEKRHKVYANEFKEAQKFREEHEKDDEKIRNELEEKTINNTLINKFAGKINLDKNDEK